MLGETIMGHRQDIKNRRGVSVAILHIPSEADNKYYEAKKKTIEDSKELHSELEDIKKLKKELQGKLNDIH